MPEKIPGALTVVEAVYKAMPETSLFNTWDVKPNTSKSSDMARNLTATLEAGLNEVGKPGMPAPTPVSTVVPVPDALAKPMMLLLMV